MPAQILVLMSGFIRRLFAHHSILPVSLFTIFNYNNSTINAPQANSLPLQPLPLPERRWATALRFAYCQ